MGTSHNVKSVLDAAKACREAFQGQLESLQHTDTNNYALFEDQYGRFNIWCSNIGVFAPGRGSMDYRLRNAEDIQDLVIRMLDTLSTHVQQVGVRNLVQGEWTGTVEQKPISAHNLRQQDLTTTSNGDHDQDFSSISKDITLLHKLSNTIRKASAEGSNEKAAAVFSLIDEDGNDFSLSFRDRFAATIIEHRFPDASLIIRERLANAMLLRRRRFVYRKHRYQNNPFRLPQLADTKQTFAQLTPTPKSLAPSVATPDGALTPASCSYPKSLSQAPTATTLDIDRYRKFSAPSRVPTVRTMAIHHDIQGDFPPLPKSHDHDDPVCPYCFLVLLNGETKTTHTWNEHVKTDLDAYVCLFEDCETPDTLYAHSKDWLNHMKQSHRMEWRCSSKSHEPVVLQTRAEYEDHIKQKHKGPIPQKQISLLADKSARPIQPLFTSCPLCGIEQADIGMENHVASHLRYLALKCLPWLDEVEDTLPDTDSGTVETRATLAQSLAASSMLVDHSISPLDGESNNNFERTLSIFGEHVSIDNLLPRSRGRRYMRYILTKTGLEWSDGMLIFERSEFDETLEKMLKHSASLADNSGASSNKLIQNLDPFFCPEPTGTILDALNAGEDGKAWWMIVSMESTIFPHQGWSQEGLEIVVGKLSWDKDALSQQSPSTSQIHHVESEGTRVKNLFAVSSLGKFSHMSDLAKSLILQDAAASTTLDNPGDNPVGKDADDSAPQPVYLARLNEHGELISDSRNSFSFHRGDTSSQGAQGNTRLRTMRFVLRHDETPKGTSRVLRLKLLPNNTAESIVAAVKSFYKMHDSDNVRFEDHDGNILDAPLLISYDEPVYVRTVYVRKAVIDSQTSQLRSQEFNMSLPPADDNLQAAVQSENMLPARTEMLGDTSNTDEQLKSLSADIKEELNSPTDKDSSFASSLDELSKGEPIASRHVMPSDADAQNKGEIFIKCVCMYGDDDGNTVCCSKCDTWQHIWCYYYGENVPDEHFCIDCLPRDLNPKKAAERQRMAREQLRTGLSVHGDSNDKNNAAKSTPTDEVRPTWIRVALKHLSPETLEAYELKWDYDPEDWDYLIIKQYVDHPLQQELFEHTRMIRKRRVKSNAKDDTIRREESQTDTDIDIQGRTPPTIDDTSETQAQKASKDLSVYLRVACKHLLPETLIFCRIPWEYDHSNDGYVIVKQYLDPTSQQQLFDDTNMILQKTRRHFDKGRSTPRHLASANNTLYRGTAYDYVFDIKVDKRPPVKLPYFISHHPYDAATRFVKDQNLPIADVKDIADIIINNTRNHYFSQIHDRSRSAKIFSILCRQHRTEYLNMERIAAGLGISKSNLTLIVYTVGVKNRARINEDEFDVIDYLASHQNDPSQTSRRRRDRRISILDTEDIHAAIQKAEQGTDDQSRSDRTEAVQNAKDQVEAPISSNIHSTAFSASSLSSSPSMPAPAQAQPLAAETDLAALEKTREKMEESFPKMFNRSSSIEQSIALQPTNTSEELVTPTDSPLGSPSPVIRKDENGVQWISFEYSRNRVKIEYTIRCDIESVDIDQLSQDFKAENCVYPGAYIPAEKYKGNRLAYETECNAIGWALAELNPSLRQKRGLIQRAADSWRNSNQHPRLRSRRVRRQEEYVERKSDEVTTENDSSNEPTNQSNSQSNASPGPIQVPDQNQGRLRTSMRRKLLRYSRPRSGEAEWGADTDSDAEVSVMSVPEYERNIDTQISVNPDDIETSKQTSTTEAIDALPQSTPVHQVGDRINGSYKQWDVTKVYVKDAVSAGASQPTWMFEITAIEADEAGSRETRILRQDSPPTGAILLEEPSGDPLQAGLSEWSDQQGKRSSASEFATVGNTSMKSQLKLESELNPDSSNKGATNARSVRHPPTSMNDEEQSESSWKIICDVCRLIIETTEGYYRCASGLCAGPDDNFDVCRSCYAHGESCPGQKGGKCPELAYITTLEKPAMIETAQPAPDETLSCDLCDRAILPKDIFHRCESGRCAREGNTFDVCSVCHFEGERCPGVSSDTCKRMKKMFVEENSGAAEKHKSEPVYKIRCQDCGYEGHYSGKYNQICSGCERPLMDDRKFKSFSIATDNTTPTAKRDTTVTNPGQVEPPEAISNPHV